MIEVVTPRPRDQRRDRLEKMDEYASFGVRWYWIVDLEARLLEIYERDARGVYARVRGASEGCVRDIPGLVELEVNLDAAWARIDALGEDEEGE
jgi:Uma2 family endonuclease